MSEEPDESTAETQNEDEAASDQAMLEAMESVSTAKECFGLENAKARSTQFGSSFSSILTAWFLQAL